MNLTNQKLRKSEGRKSKDVCKQLLSTSLKNNDDETDSDNYQEPEYDSDVDPEFKYSDDSVDEEEDNSESSEHVSNESEASDSEASDTNQSALSHLTDFNETFDLLTQVFNNDVIPSIKSRISSAEDLEMKQTSKRKISEECMGIYGLAQKCVWDGKYDEALDQCENIIKEYPSFWGTYDVLAQIYEHKGDLKKANQLYYTAAMCNPKDTDRWLACIENTKELEGIEKAIEITKLALTRTNNNLIREMFVELLEGGGYIKEALKRKMANIKAAPVETQPDVIEETVTDLFYLSEKFESLKDLRRSSKCLEIINSKYPQFLTDEHRINLLKSMITVNMLNGVFNVASRIEGVNIVTNVNDIQLSFSNDISMDYRRQVIFATMFTGIHLKMSSFISDPAFTSYVKELVDSVDVYLTIVNKLFELKYYDNALELAQYLVDKTDDKLAPLKIIGKSQEALGRNNEALDTYDLIINKINERDASIWELKANLLYRLQREEDAIQVLAESQRFIRENRTGQQLSDRCKPTKESVQLLYKLCKLLHNEARHDDFIKAAWKFIFIDSYEYFAVNKIDLCCEDIDLVRPRIHEIQNDIWLCISKTADSTKHGLFQPSHSKTPEDSTWNILRDLLTILAQTNDNFDLIELLVQWGFVLHKLLNLSFNRRLELSAIYVSVALRNRIDNHRLRMEVSGNMIFQELRILGKKYGEKNQFWNLFQINSLVMGTNNSRFLLRNMSQTKNTFPLELINAGYVLTRGAKLSLAINGKLFVENRTNPQISLHMAITLINAALSRNTKDPLKPMKLALGFLNEYRRHRGECQETFYNMGRFYHRISYEHLAMAYYEKCLALPPTGNTDYERSLNDLTKEAAFNLVYIYKGRNNPSMVGYLTQKYLVM